MPFTQAMIDQGGRMRGEIFEQRPVIRRRVQRRSPPFAEGFCEV
jgi:hypothetical protein